MRKIIIPLILLLSLTPLLVYAQESLSELEQGLTEEKSDTEKISCPEGTREKIIGSVGIVCVDDITGKLSYPPKEISYTRVYTGITILIIVISAIIATSLLLKKIKRKKQNK